MHLQDKIALVTGASRGIGEALALGMAKAGADIFVHYHSKPELAEKVAEQIRAAGRKAWTVRADVQNPREIETMFDDIEQQSNRLDILVNNAGFEFGKPLWEFSAEEWDSIINVNLRGAFLCLKHAVHRFMRKQQYGKIINISSIHDQVPRKRFAPYCVSKAGLLMLTKAAAQELAEHNIHVNAVSPGAILTDMYREAIENIGPDFGPRNIPWRRVGETDEVVGAVVYLACDDSSYVTGTTIYIDGGYRLHAIRE